MTLHTISIRSSVLPPLQSQGSLWTKKVCIKNWFTTTKWPLMHIAIK